MEQELIQQALSLKSSQGLTHSKSGELERFEIAIAQPKLIEAPLEEIKQNLRYAMILVGVRANTINAMAEEEKMILVEFLREKYPYHTAAELKIAFTKAAAHELDIKEVNHYENFTCEYVGRIMSAYRVWASEQHQAIYNKKRLQELWDELPTSQKYNGMELVDIYYQEFLKGEFKKELATDLAWETVYSKFKPTYTEEEIDNVYKQARNEVLAKQQESITHMEYNGNTSVIFRLLKQSKYEMERLSFEECKENREIKKAAKIIALCNWFEMIKQKGITSANDYQP